MNLKCDLWSLFILWYFHLLKKNKIGWRQKARRMVIYTTDIHFHQAGDGRVSFFFIFWKISFWIILLAWFVDTGIYWFYILLFSPFGSGISLMLIYIVHVGHNRIKWCKVIYHFVFRLQVFWSLMMAYVI